jgi:uracil phosphoribosyltransferase
MVFVPILRAGLGLLDGILPLVPDASVAHVGIKRNEETALPQSYYANLPANLASADVFLLDPMLATGGSACEGLRQLKEAGALRITMICVVSCPEGLAALEHAHPDVPVFTASIDDGLNEKCYIVPGLGDAGDRYFGT